MSKEPFVTIVVLNDGETFTDITGCTIRKIPLSQYEETTRMGGDAKDFDAAEIIDIETLL